MSKGVGIGEAMLGKATGDLVKPGLTRTDLEKIERENGKPHGPTGSSSDPFEEVFLEQNRSKGAKARVAAAGKGRGRSSAGRGAGGRSGSVGGDMPRRRYSSGADRRSAVRRGAGAQGRGARVKAVSATAEAEADGDDILAALDAQAHEIGNMLEKRIEDIDSHWRRSGTGVGAQPKSGAHAKSKAAPRRLGTADGKLLVPRKAAGAVPGTLPKASGASALGARPKMVAATARRFLGHFSQAGKSRTPPQPPPKHSQRLGAGAQPKVLPAGAAPKAWPRVNANAALMPKAPPRGVVASLGGPPRPPPPPPGAPPLETTLPPPPPGEGGADGAESIEALQDEEDDDYDPFAEEPAPHVAAQQSVVKARADRAAFPWRQKNSEDIPLPAPRKPLKFNAQVVPLVPPLLPLPLPLPPPVPLPTAPQFQAAPRYGKRKSMLAPAASQSQAGVALWPKAGARAKAPTQAEPLAKAAAVAVAVASVEDKASDWLNKRGPSQRQVAGAKIAEEYFKTSTAGVAEAAAKAASEIGATPPLKRRRKEPTAEFSPELLAKAPSSIQTCRSLLLFLEKKLGEKVPVAPAVLGPDNLREKLERHAALAGRLSSLEEKSGWDARAKRVVDVGAAAKAADGQAVVEKAKKWLEASAAEVVAKLKEQEEIQKIAGLPEQKVSEVDTLVKERREWEQSKVRRSWLAWCAQLLRSREAKLLAEVNGGGAAAAATKQPNRLGAVDPRLLGPAEILQALLDGQEPSKDVGVSQGEG